MYNSVLARMYRRIPTRLTRLRHGGGTSTHERPTHRPWLAVEELEDRRLLTAVTIDLSPSKDNTLFESSIGSVSSGAGQHVFAGTTGQGSDNLRRAVMAFDVASVDIPYLLNC